MSNSGVAGSLLDATAWSRPLLAPLETAAQLPLAVWAMAALAVLLSHALRAGRLAAEWQPRVGLHWGAALRLSLLHNAAVCLLPFRSGELGYAWWLHRGWGVPLRQSAPSLLWLRLQDLTVLSLLTVVCLLPGALWLQPLWLGLALLFFVAALPLLHSRALPLLSALSSPGQSPPWVQSLAQALACGHRARASRRAWCFAALNWSTRLAVQGSLLALLLELPLWAAVRGAAGGEWGSLLPLQLPAGIGPQQGAVWLALQTTPVQLPSSLSVLGAALCVHLFWVGVGLLGAVVAALYPGERRWRRAPHCERPAAEPAAGGSP